MRCEKTKKISYPSPQRAWQVLKQDISVRKRERKDSDHARSTPFRCEFCGRWHLGSVWKNEDKRLTFFNSKGKRWECDPQAGSDAG